MLPEMPFPLTTSVKRVKTSYQLEPSPLTRACPWCGSFWIQVINLDLLPPCKDGSGSNMKGLAVSSQLWVLCCTFPKRIVCGLRLTMRFITMPFSIQDFVVLVILNEQRHLSALLLPHRAISHFLNHSGLSCVAQVARFPTLQLFGKHLREGRLLNKSPHQCAF